VPVKARRFISTGGVRSRSAPGSSSYLGDDQSGLPAILEAGLAPAIKDSINKMIGYRIFGGDRLAALFAFPEATLTF
jgi:hypothetical protein